MDHVEWSQWRVSLGPSVTQADAWRECQRGDWMLYELWVVLSPERYDTLYSAVCRALNRIVARAIRRGFRSLRGVRTLWATAWRCWARKWLSGEERSVEVAEEIAFVTEAACAEVARAAAGAAKAVAAWRVAAARSAAASAALAALEAEAARALWGEALPLARELALQAHDLRREIPEWPGS